MGAWPAGPPWPAAGSAGAGAPAAAGPRGSAAGADATGAASGACEMATPPPFTILTFSSPSVISSSAMPDSCTRSISFFSFRRSMVFPLAGRRSGGARCRSALAPHLLAGLRAGLRRSAQGEIKREVVAAAAEAADHAHGQVGKERAVAKGLPGMDVGQVHLDERYRHPG